VAGEVVVGFDALGRDMQKLASPTGPLGAAVALAADGAIGQPVAAVARSAVPQVTGRLAGSVTVRREPGAAGAEVSMGSSSLRYAGWIEFGGLRRAPHESRRDYDSRGRYLWPAATNVQGSVADRFGTAASSALASFPWTNTTTDPGGVHD